MPFGLKCASNSCIRTAQQILQPIHEFNDSYVDDLATFSDNWPLHLDHVRQFLSVMRSSGFTLKLENVILRNQRSLFKVMSLDLVGMEWILRKFSVLTT